MRKFKEQIVVFNECFHFLRKIAVFPFAAAVQKRSPHIMTVCRCICFFCGDGVERRFYHHQIIDTHDRKQIFRAIGFGTLSRGENQIRKGGVPAPFQISGGISCKRKIRCIDQYGKIVFRHAQQNRRAAQISAGNHCRFRFGSMEKVRAPEKEDDPEQCQRTQHRLF